jgi:hypothetical protein
VTGDISHCPVDVYRNVGPNAPMPRAGWRICFGPCDRDLRVGPQRLDVPPDGRERAAGSASGFLMV